MRILLGWLLAVGLAIAVGGCGGGEESPRLEKGENVILPLEGKFREKWRPVAIPDQGDAVVTGDGLLKMGAGKPMTGIVFHGGSELGIPVQNYVVEFEARRVEGSDFFAAFTFPAGSKKRCATLVLGGWGGSLVGISSIDHLDASENTTRASIPFENGRWYQIKLEVTAAAIRVWIDSRIVVNATTAGRVVGMRPGDIELCAPFGFATYGSIGEVRNLRVKMIAR